MKQITLTQPVLSTDWHVKYIETDEKRYSVTKILGGQEIVLG